MSLYKFNKCLLELSGVSGLVIFNQVYQTPKHPKHFFFHTPERPSSTLFKALTIFMAPVALSIFTLEVALHTIYSGLRSLFEFARGQPDAGGALLVETVLNLALTLVAAVSVFASPFANLIDLLGGHINCSSSNNVQNENLGSVSLRQ